MTLIARFVRLLARVRHPYSLPCEIGEVFGLSLPTLFCFEKLLAHLQHTDFQPTTLYKDMPKWEALSLFGTAPKQELFPDRISLSYPLSYGWIQFDLVFDKSTHRLRRLFLRHPKLPLGASHEIRLKRT